MPYLWLQNKKRILAPIGYLLLQAALLVGFALACSSIVSSEDIIFVIFFWLSTLMTILLYFATHLKNPGFISQNNNSFREQNSIHVHIPVKNENQKAVDLKNQSSAQESLIHEPFDKFQNKSQANTKKLKFPDNMTNSFTNFPTNMKLSTREKTIPITGTLQTQEIGEKDEKDNDLNKIETINLPKEYKKGSLNVICEPSIIEKEESEESSSGDYEGRIDFNQKSQEILEVSDEDLIIHETEKQTGKNQSNSFSCKKPTKEDRIVYIYKTVQTEIDDDFEIKNRKRNTLRSHLGRSLDRKTSSNQDPTADASCNVPLQTGDDDQSKEDKIKELNSRSDIPLKNVTQNFAIRNNQLMFGSYLKVPMAFEDPAIYRKEVDNSNIKIPSEPSDEIRPATPKPQETRNIQNIHIQIDDQERNHSDAFFVEKRYCTVCNLEQPFRAKHCKHCDRCIARYDHHCPWLGNCIGERNHFWFYWYLVFQVAEIVLGQIKLYLCIFKENHNEDGPLYAKIILLAVATFFFAMTASLLVFHTYLAFVNLSTWERLSWGKITYLTDWSKAWGSPFSKGVVGNLLYFCCERHKGLVDWQIPKHKLPEKPHP